MRIAIGVSYDGAGFNGWQSQPDGNTVQDHLERALGTIARSALRLTGAGRTDAGVHALAQVAHFDTAVTRPESAWVRGANALLPARIAVQWAAPVTDEFNARFSAVSRRYLYLMYCHPVRPALLAGKTGWHYASLDVAAMREAARCLVGRHDFSAFRSSQCQAKTPVRTLTRLVIDTDGPYLRFDLLADAFLHHMVRNIVGCLLYVGDSRQQPGWVSDILESRDRRRGAPTLAPDGLYLAGVGYEARWRLPHFPRIMPFLPEQALGDSSSERE